MEFRPFTVELSTVFRGHRRRSGVLIGAAGLHSNSADARGDHWGEYSPFADYDAERASRWWRAAMEAARGEWPEPVRTEVAVNSIVPLVPAASAAVWATAHGATTAKVKVSGGDGLAEDAARVAAVAEALGPGGAIRIDVNGAWDLDQAEHALRELEAAARAGGAAGLAYVEQPCADVADLAALRRRVTTRIAADESVRLPGHADAVLEADAADVIVLKAAPLGGVRRCLELAEAILERRPETDLVVSSAMESSVGLASGVALACALPREPLACGLGTGSLLATDTVRGTLLPVNGRIGMAQIGQAQEVTA